MRFFFEIIYNRFIYRNLLKRKLKKVGHNFRLGYYSEINNPNFFSIGNNFYSGPFGLWSTNKNNPVQIGNNVMFGPKCNIQGGNHDAKFEGFMASNSKIDGNISEIIINDGAWVGTACTIVSGANIGEGSIIGAMSLVNSTVPPYVVAAGVPIKVIKTRFDNINQLKNTLENTNSKLLLEDLLDLYKSLNISFPSAQ